MFKKWSIILLALALVLTSVAAAPAPTQAGVERSKFSDSGLKSLIRMQETTSGNLVGGKYYVIFKVNKSQLYNFQTGIYGIYRYDAKTHTYSKVPAFVVNVGRGNRIAAVAYRFGRYSFGKVNP